MQASTLPAKPVSKDKAAWLLRALGIGLSVALGAWLGWQLVRVAERLGGHSSSNLGILAVGYSSCVLLYLASVPLHEMGHWLGARWVGFRCQVVAVLWLYLERKGERWKFRLGARTPGLLGHMVALPLDFTDFRRRQASYVLAGPVANLLIGVPLLLLSNYLQGVAEQTSDANFVRSETLLVFAVLSVFQGLINLLPMTARADGTKLLELWRNGPAWQRQVAIQQITAAIMRYVRPRQWASEWLPPLLALADQSATECLAHYYAYAYAYDTGNRDVACTYLQRAADLLPKMTPLFQQIICCEVLYCNVVLADEPAQAAPWLARANQAKPLAPREKPFTRAIMAYSQQNRPEALGWLRQYEVEIAAWPDSSVKEQAYEGLAETRTLVERLPSSTETVVSA